MQNNYEHVELKDYSDKCKFKNRGNNVLCWICDCFVFPIGCMAEEIHIGEVEKIDKKN